MTTEEDFQAALDANPEDWQTRLVFADWLEEHGDPRAEGYRAIARLPRCNCRSDGPDKVPFIWMKEDFGGLPAYARLPNDWFEVLVAECTAPQLWDNGMPADFDPRGRRYMAWLNFSTRREADDAAALAFAKLPPERRAELLKGALA